MSKIIVEDIFAEDLFKWFFNHVMSSGGDGSGAIVCFNHEEVADLFISYLKEEFDYDILKFLYKDKIGNDIIISDRSNESFLFSQNCDIKYCSKDYVFIVKEDCSWGWKGKNKPNIKGINL